MVAWSSNSNKKSTRVLKIINQLENLQWGRSLKPIKTSVNKLSRKDPPIKKNKKPQTGRALGGTNHRRHTRSLWCAPTERRHAPLPASKVNLLSQLAPIRSTPGDRGSASTSCYKTLINHRGLISASRWHIHCAGLFLCGCLQIMPPLSARPLWRSSGPRKIPADTGGFFFVFVFWSGNCQWGSIWTSGGPLGEAERRQRPR